MNTNELRKCTVMSRYSVDNVSKVADVQEKRRSTFEKKRTTVVFYQDPRVNVLDGYDMEVFRINKDVADEWLNKYHPFKAPRGNILCLGLVKDDVLYCLMTFKKARNPRYTIELSRMWMLPTYDIQHGYDILSQAAVEFGLYNIVAYVNLSFEDYQAYESIGMKYVKDMQRTKWWIRRDIRLSDASRRQHKITESQLISEGWNAVYDCGQRVYSFK